MRRKGEQASGRSLSKCPRGQRSGTKSGQVTATHDFLRVASCQHRYHPGLRMQNLRPALPVRDTQASGDTLGAAPARRAQAQAATSLRVLLAEGMAT